MKNYVLLTCLAVVLYASQNVLMELKFAKYSAISILLISYSVMLPLVLIGIGQMYLSGNPVSFPTGKLLLLAFVTGFLWFVADYCYVSAYTLGGNLLTITTIIAVFPVVASVIKFFVTGMIPNWYQVTGWILAICAVYLVGKGTVS